MTHRKYFVISLILIFTASIIITMSDYWTGLNAAMLQSESYANRTASHISHQLFQEGGFIDALEDPESLTAMHEGIENLIQSFELINIKIFNRDQTIIFSLDKDAIGQEVSGNAQLSLALEGTRTSHVATPGYHEKTYGGKINIPMLETYVPIVHPGSKEIVGAFEIYQDYRPVKNLLFQETLRSGTTHFIMLLVFAGLFYRYGRYTSRLLGSHQETLIAELEDRVEERTVELKRSRDRVNDLLRRKDEMFRNLMIADEYKKDFMGLVSHELRTPLTVIKGYLTMMNEGDLGPVYTGLQDVVSTCLVESNKLEDLINNILELSQLERGLFDLSGEKFDVRELFGEVISNLSLEAYGRENDLSVEVSEEVATFTSDRIKIMQVLQQFISNALKFSKEGSAITLKATPSHRGLLLSVSDEGVGIPAGQAGEIFNQFYQVDISTTRSFEGSGLGLAIVHKIAQTLGGRTWVESVEGKGSTFYFEVEPLDTSRSRSVETVMSGDALPAARLKDPDASHHSILLIDDDEDYLFLLRRILIDDGYTVEMCKDGLMALNRIFGPELSPLPSLIILDIRMPNIHGIDLLRILRRNMTTRELPVIVVSALGLETQVQEGVSAGANAYFVKPFDPDTLLDRIAFLLGKETSAEG